jgi:hypothetical protein
MFSRLLYRLLAGRRLGGAAAPSKPPPTVKLAQF